MPRRVATGGGTAVHEAGHAVAALTLDVPVRYVSMRPNNPDAAAHVMHGRLDDTASMCERCMVVAAAGLVAEDLYHGHDGEERDNLVDAAYNDLRALAAGAVNIDSAYGHHAGTRRPATAHANPMATAEWAWREAVELVYRHWRAVAAVAGVLHCARRAVTGNQLHRAIAEGEPAWFVGRPRHGWQVTPRRRDLTFWPSRYTDLTTALKTSA
jgi:hypothetical protein